MRLCGDSPKVVGIFVADGREENQFCGFSAIRGALFSSIRARSYYWPLLSTQTPRIMQDPGTWLKAEVLIPYCIRTL